MQGTKTVVCLAWGSLAWNPGDLPLRTRWRNDGPFLPVEFARQSRDGRITLVLLEGAIPVPVLWAEMRSRTLSDAVAALAEREGTPVANIGRWTATDPVSAPRAVGQ